MHKSLLLLVDNADRLFETIESQQQWRLRELLLSRRDLTFFGATTQASDGIYGPDRAFFEFFKIHRLTPLTFTEVRDLLLQLSESVEEKEGEKGNAKLRVAQWLDADAARLRTLVQLTGGNPRTTVLLFHLVLDGLVGSAREYLEQLLDQVTPNYKGRVDELPPQAQQVLDAVALRWDPVTAMEVGESTGLETGAVSTHLTRLVRQGVLEKADPGESKKALYQVAERFFNIWYLMRASRRVRARLRWFVEFLRVFFDSGELEQMAVDRIERYRSTWRGHPEEIETAFAYVLASGAARARFEGYLRSTCADSEEIWLPYFDLLGPPMADKKRVSGSGAETTSMTKRDDQIDQEAELRKMIGAQPENAANWAKLGSLLMRDRGRAGEAEAAYREAIGFCPESASAWAGLGLFLALNPERGAEAAVALRKGIGLAPIELAPVVPRLWNLLGDVLARSPELAADAESSYRKAIELDPKLADFWKSFGILLAKAPDRAGEAEAAFRRAIELDPKIAGSWIHLGILLAMTPERANDAEVACRKAIELDPQGAIPWSLLGVLLAATPERAEEAEAALRRAIELAPEAAYLWYSLGIFLAISPERVEEAEAATRKAIAMDPEDAEFWKSLGTLLSRNSERTGDAESAYRQSVKLDPSNAGAWGYLGILLACQSGKPKEAERAFRNSLRLEPDNSLSIRNLGVLLYCELSEPQEAVLYLRRAHGIDPGNPVSAAILAASLRDEAPDEQLSISIDAARGADFWKELLTLCQNYPPFGKILLGICDLVQERDGSNQFARLYRAVALAQLGDFPRASVALEDALTADPIDVLSYGQSALETFFASAV